MAGSRPKIVIDILASAGKAEKKSRNYTGKSKANSRKYPGRLKG